MYNLIIWADLERFAFTLAFFAAGILPSFYRLRGVFFLFLGERLWLGILVFDGLLMVILDLAFL